MPAAPDSRHPERRSPQDPLAKPVRVAATSPWTTLPDLTFLSIPVQHTPHCTSTMDIVATLAAAGAPEGTCVTTDEQTAGRGRAGRAWSARPGTSLLLSALLTPTVASDRLGQLSILLAVCVARLVEHRTGRAAAIKWPNDVLIDGRKIAGILTQTRFPNDGGTPDVIIGIGLNVNLQLDDLPPSATSLLALTGRRCDRTALRRDLLAEIEATYRAFLVGDTGPAWHEATTRLAYQGETVQITEGDRQVAGTLLGLAPSGALRLCLQGGDVREIWSGDLVRGPRRISA